MWFGFKERILICQSAVICRVADCFTAARFLAVRFLAFRTLAVRSLAAYEELRGTVS
jgi:hypothetical protein